MMKEIVDQIKNNKITHIILQAGVGGMAGAMVAGIARYLDNIPKDSRLGLYGDWFTRYSDEPTIEAVRKYVALARDHGMSPTELSLAFVNTRPFVTSNIIGATKMDQLKENIKSIEIKLTDQVIEQIEEIHKSNPNPAP